jgi:hypothetical protein
MVDPRAVIQLFHTCLVNEIYPDVAMAAVRVLERLGFEVNVPLVENCQAPAGKTDPEIEVDGVGGDAPQRRAGRFSVASDVAPASTSVLSTGASAATCTAIRTLAPWAR